MKWIILFLSIALTKLCFAEDLKLIERFPIQGKIGNQEIFMTLTKEDNLIYGSYYYKNYKTPINLTGKLTYNSLNLIENEGKVEAQIHAKIDEKSNIIGKWSGNREYNFTGKILTYLSKSMLEKAALKVNGDAEYYLLVFLKNKKIQEIPLEIEPDTKSIYLEDFNFDGYPDLQVPEITSGANSSYTIYIYNPEKEEYELAPKEIRNLTNPKVNHDSKEIKSIIRENCCSYAAQIMTPSITKKSEFDYLKGKGTETIFDINRNLKTKKLISKEYFERIYMN